MKSICVPLLFLGFAGCQHVPPTFVVREVPVQVSSTNSLDVIRFPSTYKGYTVGRRPDVSNPGMMHEAHVLYVRETADRWNLHSPAISNSEPEHITKQQMGRFDRSTHSLGPRCSPS